MYNNSCFLSLGMVVDFEQNLAKLGRHYHWLSVQAHSVGITMWQTVPKFQSVLGHLGNQAALMNPRWVQGYASESIVGTTSSIYVWHVAKWPLACSGSDSRHGKVQGGAQGEYGVVRSAWANSGAIALGHLEETTESITL
jgi:hypothetical protein